MSKTDKRRSFTWLNNIIKFLVSILLVYVIYKHLTSADNLFAQWTSFISSKSIIDFLPLIIVFLLMPLNVFSEVIKWNILVLQFENKNKLGKSFLAVMTGMTAALVTPARIGEYFGKMMFVKTENNWKVVWANLLNSISLYIVIIMGGIIGALYLFSRAHFFQLDVSHTILLLAAIFCVLLLVFYFNFRFLYRFSLIFRKIKFLEKMIGAIKKISSYSRNTLLKILSFSLIRYMIFVLQYLLVLIFFDFERDWILLVAAITTNYLLLSAIPLPPIMGLLARAEIALLIFSSFSDNELLILLAALTLWFINQVIPALIGLFIMFKVNIIKTFGYG